MAISKKALEEFRRLYKEEYGIDIPEGIALEAAIRLISTLKAVLRPIPKEKMGELESIRKEQAKIPASEKVDLVKHIVMDTLSEQLKEEKKNRKPFGFRAPD